MAAFAEILQTVNFEDQQHRYRVLKEQTWNHIGRDLSDDEISVLAKRICALPEEYRNVLFAHYYFKFSPKETAEMFGIEEPVGKYR